LVKFATANPRSIWYNGFMSKRFKGKTCVYCGAAPSTTTGDHVFAREFFINVRRGNLPKIPACEACNHEKSKLEHYLTAVLPFGGRHIDSAQNLSTLVEPRLAKNAKLYNALNAGRRQVWGREGGLLVPVSTLPIDGDKIDRLFVFIIKGLLWHHWNVILEPGRHGLWAGFLTPAGVQVHRQFFAMNGNARVSANLGEGTFSYEGLQGTDIPEMSVWLFSVYGGMKLSGDPQAPHEECSIIGGVTATREGLAEFLRLLNPDLRPAAQLRQTG
jgi:hypothetical protein